MLVERVSKIKTNKNTQKNLINNGIDDIFFLLLQNKKKKELLPPFYAIVTKNKKNYCYKFNN